MNTCWEPGGKGLLVCLRGVGGPELRGERYVTYCSDSIWKTEVLRKE